MRRHQHDIDELARMECKVPEAGQTTKRSLRAIAAELARLGHMNERGGTFSASSIRSMLS
jgi:hypothetical protein